MIQTSCFCSNTSFDVASQSQSRLILCVTGSGGGSFSWLVQFEETGFFYDNSHLTADGIHQFRQSPFFWSFSRVPIPVDQR